MRVPPRALAVVNDGTWRPRRLQDDVHAVRAAGTRGDEGADACEQPDDGAGFGERVSVRARHDVCCRPANGCATGRGTRAAALPAVLDEQAGGTPVDSVRGRSGRMGRPH
ncbi:MAG TPA: hypothetical protein VMU14_19185 [Acidimicrobiales bacterium]|nr:hypothetical protein [Acidimicrobiales bacterium]